MDVSLQQSLAALPHGPEFRFVDTLTTLDPGRSATGQYLIKGTEEFLGSHFPGNPMMPGVLMVEAIAQVAGIAAQPENPASDPLTDLRLASIGRAKILGVARPGDQLLIHAAITRSMGDLIQAEGHIVIDGQQDENPQPIAKAQLTLSFVS